jgi:hypothetical protein
MNERLMLEASLFSLASKCFPICASTQVEGESINANLREIVSLKDGDQLQLFNQKFATCMRECTVSYIETREFVRNQFMQDMDDVVKENDAIYRSFGTGYSNV